MVPPEETERLQGMKFRVWYLCHDCGGRFYLMQGDDEPDEGVCICWDCIDKMLGKQ
jgi:DNA-directed RNA polymerase subunit RPC12/RpoP